MNLVVAQFQPKDGANYEFPGKVDFTIYPPTRSIAGETIEKFINRELQHSH